MKDKNSEVEFKNRKKKKANKVWMLGLECFSMLTATLNGYYGCFKRTLSYKYAVEPIYAQALTTQTTYGKLNWAILWRLGNHLDALTNFPTRSFSQLFFSLTHKHNRSHDVE